MPPARVDLRTHVVELEHRRAHRVVTVRGGDRQPLVGVDVTVEQVEDAPHVWHVFSSVLHEGRQSIEQIAQFVRKHSA